MAITSAKKWIINQIMVHDALQSLDLHFQKLNITYMPIKGAYLVCTGLAEKMKQRTMRDLDILVKNQDMQIASDYFINLQSTKLKRYYKDNYRPTETAFLYPVNQAYISVEIHCQLNFSERFHLPTQKLFERSFNLSQVKHLPSTEDSLCIFLCHLQSHIPLEYHYTTLEEVYLLSSQSGFSWPVFWEIAQTTGIESFLFFILKLFENTYHLPIQSPRSYLYAYLLSTVFTESRYKTMPGWLKRVLFDLPFVRKPGKLVFHKLTKRKYH